MILKYILDTHIAIYTIKGRPQEVREAFKAHDGQLWAGLWKVGRPIGPYDEMIAGHARSQALIVVTNNTKQFEDASGIRLANRVK